MRIAIFTDTWIPQINGAVVSIQNEIAALKDEHEFFVFAPRTQKTPGQTDPEGAIVYRLRSVAFPAYPGYYMVFLDPSLGKWLSKERFDIIHSHGPFSLGILARVASRVNKAPLVTTFHTWLSEYVGHLFHGFAQKQITRALDGFSWGYTRLYYNRVQVIITPSHTLKLEMERRGIKPPIFYIPNPISPVFFEKKFSPKEKDRITIKFREKFGIAPDDRIILYVGRVSYEKRLEILLDAFQHMRKKRKDIHLVIVGEGPHLGHYRNRAKKMRLKSCTFTGYVSHNTLPEVYSSGDIFVSPSDTETQGLTLIEAMSQGLPVVTVKAGGIQDYLKNKKNGLMVKPKDPLALEKGIQFSLENPDIAQEWAKKGKKTSQNYTFEGFREKIIAAYEQGIELRH